MTPARITLRHLFFNGPHKRSAALRFSPGVNLVFGASNTGKSFALKALDFMLGSSRDLPDIPERVGYDQSVLGLSIDGDDFTFVRSTSGGKFIVFDGLHEIPPDSGGTELSAKHDPNSSDNLSEFLLERIGLAGKAIVQNAAGRKRSISFRDLAHLLIVDETTIQVERSPVETGQYTTRTSERSVLRLLLTGVDDSAIVQVDDQEAFATSRAARIDLLNQLVEEMDETLRAEYPDASDLPGQLERLNKSVERVQTDIERSRAPVAARSYPNYRSRPRESQSHLATAAFA